jgi:hypothetical protein
VVVFIILTFKNVIGTMLFWMNMVILVAGIVWIWVRRQTHARTHTQTQTHKAFNPQCLLTLFVLASFGWAFKSQRMARLDQQSLSCAS